MEPEPSLLQLVVSGLNRASIDHMVTGSFASTFHGEPRMTRDIDLVINPSVDAIQMLASQFPAPRYYWNDAVMAVQQRDMFNLIDTSTGWKVDLTVRKDRPFSVMEFGRRRRAEIDGVATFVTTGEDAVLSKLEWQRDSAPATQRRDVVEMLRANVGRLDHEYLNLWASRLDVGELLVAVMSEAGSGGQV